MTRLDTLFFDIGGVCLTNGWDTDARLAAASHFVLDVEETEDRHQARADGFERGELSLNAYLDHVVFHRDRTFSRDAFIAFMRSRSQPNSASLSVISRLASDGLYRLATINNESREMNRYRIDTFGLGKIFSAFFSSCYLGVRKPDPRIFEIALEVMQADREASLFLDDREENVAGAQAVGLRGLHTPESGASTVTSAMPEYTCRQNGLSNVSPQREFMRKPRDLWTALRSGWWFMPAVTLALVTAASRVMRPRSTPME